MKHSRGHLTPPPLPPQPHSPNRTPSFGPTAASANSKLLKQGMFYIQLHCAKKMTRNDLPHNDLR